tara:strand:- start:2634 stop:6893 length:4260 start_codon:yes stop_codon:yes gene_type:complete
MADPFKDITLEQFEQTVKDIDTRKNIIETNPGDKVKVVKPKTTGANIAEQLRREPMSFGFGFALDYINKKRKERGEDLILDEQLESDQTTAGKEFQSALVGAGANIVGGSLSLLTIPVDYAADTNFTQKLQKAQTDFVRDHGSPKTLTGDIIRIGVQYGVPSTLTLKLVNQIPKLFNIRKKYNALRASLSKIENKFLRRSAKTVTSIARRSGQSGLSLGVADFVVAEPNRPVVFFKPVSEEGKTGKDLAAAKFINKLKFGAEGATFGVGFALAGKGLPIGAKYGLYKPGSFVLGIGAKTADTVLKPISYLGARVPGLRQIPKQTLRGADFIAGLGTKVVLPAFGAPVKATWKATLPEFSKWRTFSVESAKPIEAALKKLDNKLAYLRSLDTQTGVQYSLNTAARQEIKRAARRTEKLLESIQKRSYNLAKSFEGRYNKGIHNSPASQDYYLDGVLEFLKGQKTLRALPKELQVTAQALKKDIDQIRKTFGDLLPAGDLKTAVLKNLKGYMRKSFAIFENPGYAVKETSPLFKKAKQFALNLINGKGGAVFRVEARKVFGGSGVSQGRARELQAEAMVREVLRLGKVDRYDPIQNLNEIGKYLKIKNFIATGDELPTVIKNLLGQKNNLKASVMTTMSSMVTQSTNKMLFDRLAKELQRAGILFKSEEAAKRAGIAAPTIVSGARGIGTMKTLLQSQRNPLYGAPDLVEAITSSKGMLDGLLQSGVYKNALQLKAGAQYGKTVLSPETQVRNFYSAMMFPLARGVIGGRASATDAIAMVADDIFNAGKGNAQAELKLLANIDEGIKYGVLDENIVASELQAVLREVRNGKFASVEGLAKFLEKNPFTEKAARMYAGGDNVWKWFTYNWYKSFTKDLFKNDIRNARQWFKEIAGRDLLDTTLTGQKVDINEAIRQAAAWYTRNTIPTYSKVPKAIIGLRRTPFGNFVAFPAEMTRTTANNLFISMKEASSTNPELRAMGLRGLLGLYTVLGGLNMGVKGLYSQFTKLNEEDMAAYRQFFAPEYQRNDNIVALTKADKGRFKAVSLGDFVPQHAVTEPIEAFFAKKREKEIVKENLNFGDYANIIFGKGGPVRTFLEPYISQPIGFQPFAEVFSGRKKTGGRIWSGSDSDWEKFTKSLKHIGDVIEPGIISTSQKVRDAIIRQPSAYGTIKESSDVAIGASTGLKPYNVDILESIDGIITDYSKIRSEVYTAEKFYTPLDIRARTGQVLVDEFIAVQREAFRLQKEVYEAIQAAKRFDIDEYDIRQKFKERKGISRKTINSLLNGEFVPVTFSEPRFKKKIKKIRDNEERFGYSYNLSDDDLYPKYELKDVISNLKYNSLSEGFYYDQQDLRGEAPVENIEVEQVAETPQPEIKTPPLPKQPEPVVQPTATNIIPETGLTVAETALLSPDERAIRLKQRGIG